MSDKIKSITTFLVNNETDEKGLKHLYEERSPDGQVLLVEQYLEDGTLESRVERSLDEKNRLVEEKHYTSATHPDQHFSYEYNESGKISRVGVHYADGSVSHKNYSRDEAQKSTTIDIVDEDGDTEGKEYRRFDSEGKLLEEVIYDEDGKIHEKSEFEYNDTGNVIESVVVDAEGYELVRFYDYYFDDQGRVTRLETLNEDEEIIREDEFEFDERGNRILHSIQDKDRGYYITEKSEFNLDNRIIKQERLRGESVVESIDFKYREDGLLLQKETTRGDGIFMNYYEYQFH